MTGTTFIIRFGVVLTMVLASTHATITGMAMQVIQHKYPDTFRPGDAKYEADVLRGAEAGAAIIAETLPIHSDEEAIQAVGIQIQLLRDIRPSGAGSYFAFRMGALSALISDIFLPYGLAWTPEEEAMQKKVEADINDHLKLFEYISSNTTRTAITNVDQHFRTQLAFYGDNEMLSPWPGLRRIPEGKCRHLLYQGGGDDGRCVVHHYSSPAQRFGQRRDGLPDGAILRRRNCLPAF